MYTKDGQVQDRREMLKIKLKSLAAEAKIIRKEEKKIGTVRYVRVPVDIQKGFSQMPDEMKRAVRAGEATTGNTPEFYWRRVRMGVNPLAHEMWAHRVKDLREEARVTHVAYGLIRGRTIEKMEGDAKKPLTKAQWERIHAMVKKYGPATEDVMKVVVYEMAKGLAVI